MDPIRNTLPAATLTTPEPATTPARKGAKPPATKPLKPLRRPTIKSALAAPTNPLMDQFVRDLAVAGLAESTQHVEGTLLGNNFSEFL
jgi:hypothetical protein